VDALLLSHTHAPAQLQQLGARRAEKPFSAALFLARRLQNIKKFLEQTQTKETPEVHLIVAVWQLRA
jgi:hypothetical protein